MDDKRVSKLPASWRVLHQPVVEPQARHYKSGEAVDWREVGIIEWRVR